MMKKVVGGALIAMLAACGGSPSEGAVEVPEQYQGPVQSTDTARGEQLFNEVCGACHDGGEGPDLTAHPHAVPEVRMIVRQGEGTMPPLDANRLPDADLEAVLAYMQSIQAVH